MQSLRFISEAVQDMTAAKSLLSRSDTDGKPESVTDVESEADAADYFDVASHDTRSEVSNYHDCQSECRHSWVSCQVPLQFMFTGSLLAGLSSSSASQVDPTEEGMCFT